ncbi:MAG: DUF1730 domain-containing protein [Clostridiales bacterium]|nr:DUF1730 domain-containing protein [Clostridiales bacterium]
MRHLITQFAEQKNCLIGIADPNPIPGVRERLEQTETPFAPKPPMRKLSPADYLPDVKSVIVLGASYAPPCAEVSSIIARPGEPYTGLISSMALSPDYHRTVRALLIELAGLISAPHYKILVDSGGPVEREWAVKAGLGFWGKNCCVISPSNKGSFFNIGLLLTDLALPASQPGDMDGCGTCTRCLEACPGKALEPFRLNYKNCVSYITQKNGELSAEEQRIMGKQIYFCDICQRVCPYNEGVAPEQVKVSLTGLMNMTEDTFGQTCVYTAMNWKGFKILKRNAATVFNTIYKWG